jgi:hypothetical protein
VSFRKEEKKKEEKEEKDDGKKGEAVMTWSAPTEGVD